MIENNNNCSHVRKSLVFAVYPDKLANFSSNICGPETVSKQRSKLTQEALLEMIVRSSERAEQFELKLKHLSRQRNNAANCGALQRIAGKHQIKLTVTIWWNKLINEANMLTI